MQLVLRSSWFQSVLTLRVECSIYRILAQLDANSYPQLFQSTRSIKRHTICYIHLLNIRFVFNNLKGYCFHQLKLVSFSAIKMSTLRKFQVSTDRVMIILLNMPKMDVMSPILRAIMQSTCCINTWNQNHQHYLCICGCTCVWIF